MIQPTRTPAPLGLPTHSICFEIVRLDARGQVTERSSGEAQACVEQLPHRIPLELTAVPRGSFQMGSRDPGGYPDELPLHPVFLQSFWIGRCPITQAQWQAVMGRLPGCRFSGTDLPVENICWKEADAFCQRLSRLTGRPYRLPSEAQWEYACRAGTVTPFNLGETLTTDAANFVGVHTYREAPAGLYRHGTTPVDSFPPNEWGIFDMHGNVWEFCADAWFADYSGAPLDGSARQPGRHPAGDPVWRVCRGGSWHEPPAHCRSATRLRVAEDERMEYYGLRVVCLSAF